MERASKKEPHGYEQELEGILDKHGRDDGIGLKIRQISAAAVNIISEKLQGDRKGAAHDRVMMGEVMAVAELLNKHEIAIRPGLAIWGSIKTGIREKIARKAVVHNPRIDDSIQKAHRPSKSINIKGHSFPSVETVCEQIDMMCRRWIEVKMRSDLGNLDPVDKRREALKLLMKEKRMRSYADERIVGVLVELIDEIDGEIAILEESVEIKKALNIETVRGNEFSEADIPNKFTRKQAMALMQSLIPEFRDADNTKKAEFLTMLTPYKSKANIAQEFSYLRTEDYDEIVESWRDKLKKTGRGRPKRTI